MNMGFGPTTPGLLMTQNSQTFGWFSDTTETTNAGSVAGCWDGSKGTIMRIRSSDGSGAYQVNASTSTSVGTPLW